MVKTFIALLTATASTMAFAQAPTATPASTPSSGKVITLNQKSVAELVLKQGYKTLEVNLTAQTLRLKPAEILSTYDWRVLLETGFSKDKSIGLLQGPTPSDATYDRYTTTAKLTKPFTTGTLLGLELTRLSQKIDFDTLPVNAPPDEQTADLAGITLEQSLLGNFFGRADRATVNAAELAYQASELKRADDLENAVLDALRQFWNTYVSQESFREAVNSRDRYKKLVDAVKRKTSLGYSNPGDLPQVQAEFEAREQRVKTTSYEYLRSLENLITMLALEPGTDVKFEIPKDVPAVPKLTPKKPEELRIIRSQKLNAQAAEETLNAANSLSWPSLKFVGQAYTSGQDDTAEGAFSQLSSGTRPKYYAGLRFEYNFGSGLQEERIINARLNRDLQSTVLTRQLREIADTETQTERRVQSLYAITLSSLRQKEFREKASQELNRSYSQGRTDISILITAMNAFFDSEVAYLKALGDYATSLNEWAAVRDELIPDDAPTMTLR